MRGNDNSGVPITPTNPLPVTVVVGGGGSSGQQTMANSSPVVIASDQSPISVSITGSATSLTPTSGQPVVAAGPNQAALGTGQKDEVLIIANLTNAAKIYLGPTGVTSSNGLILEQGRGVTIHNVDLATVFINGNAADGVSWFALS